MIRLLSLSLLLFSSVAAFAQKAPKGFTWRHFPEIGVSVQVPNGWHSRVVSEKGTKALQITKEKVTSKGFETGLTINLIKRGSEKEVSAAIIGTGDYMAKLHDSFSKIIESRITQEKGVPTMILEGLRTLPNEKSRGLYHTRTVVRIFKPAGRIYTVIFGSPADQWDEEYKIGKVMLNPILYEFPQER